MTEAARILNRTFRRVAMAQLVLTLCAAVAAAWIAGNAPGHAAASALFGGLVSVLGAWRLAHSLNAATPRPAADTAAASRLYLGAAERFLGALVLLVVGIVALRLAPLALIAGFGAAQLGFFGGVPTLGRPQGVQS